MTSVVMSPALERETRPRDVLKLMAPVETLYWDVKCGETAAVGR